MTQVVPSQRSASALVDEYPTAVHAAGEVHDTAVKALCGAAGLGVAWIAQVVPSQRSASVDWAYELHDEPHGKMVAELPTAVQAVAEVQDTPVKALSVTPARLGVAWMAQLLPFQRSAKVCESPERVSNCPTAMHAEAELHDVACKKLGSAAGGLRVAWIAQLLPFQRSAKVCESPELVSKCPTAVQPVVEVHDTPNNVGSVPPGGLGVVWMAQVVPFQRSARVWKVDVRLEK